MKENVCSSTKSIQQEKVGEKNVFLIFISQSKIKLETHQIRTMISNAMKIITLPEDQKSDLFAGTPLQRIYLTTGVSEHILANRRWKYTNNLINQIKSWENTITSEDLTLEEIHFILFIEGSKSEIDLVCSTQAIRRRYLKKIKKRLTALKNRYPKMRYYAYLIGVDNQQRNRPDHGKFATYFVDFHATI